MNIIKRAQVPTPKFVNNPQLISLSQVAEDSKETEAQQRKSDSHGR